MAQRVLEWEIRTQIEWCLANLEGKWSDLPWWVENWPGLKEIEKESFYLVWTGSAKHWLSDLQGLVGQGLLTLEQQRRYAQLSRLIAERRPTLESMLGDDAIQAARRGINRILARSLAEWQDLPGVDAEIDGWDLSDQIVYIEEWTLAEERLLWLARQAACGMFTDEQTARHNDLKRLVAQNRPIIERLRAS